MRRRGFLCLGVAVLPTARTGFVAAQHKPKRIGILRPVSALADTELEAMLSRLRENGWIAGSNLAIESRYVEGTDERLEKAAAELAKLALDLIVALGSASARAARKATATTPILFSVGIDPTYTGLVTSFPRPGGNATGYYRNGLALEAKQLSVLREVIPSIERVGVMVDLRTRVIGEARSQREQVYEALRIQPLYIDVSGPEQIERAIASAAQRRAQALLSQTDEFWYIHRAAFLAAARKHALPVVSADSDIAADGGLFSLSTSEAEGDAAILGYIDKILRGAKPADLPVLQPTRFEFTLNLATARDLGIAIPTSMLVRADRVIR